MYQFFVDDCQIGKEYVTITGSDVNHIKNVLRMRPGEKIRVSSSSRDMFCEIVELTDDFVQADILDEEAPDTELPSRIYLFQGLPKGDRMEYIIQKSVELGVYEIIPGFFAGLIAAVIAASVGKAPSKEVEELYDSAVAMKD